MIKNDQLFQFISARKNLQHSYRMASTIVVQTEIYKKNVIIRELEISKANGSETHLCLNEILLSLLV